MKSTKINCNNSSIEEPKKGDSRIKAYKFVAYSAVAFSVVAVLSVVITLPMVYNYVAHVRRQMQHELGFCKASLKEK